MTGAQQQRDGDGPGSRTGRCVVCGETWIGLEPETFKSAVSRHITRNHTDEPTDKNLIEEFEILGGEADA